MRRLVAIALCLATILAVGVGGLFATSAPSSPASTGPYSWPVKPFDVAHPVRSYFNDPRIIRSSRSFHFGIDVSVPDGTAVYSVADGTAHVRRNSLSVVMEGEQRAFSYWHVIPVVANHGVVRKHQLIGYVRQGAGHVHFAEMAGRRYLNPLRPGALTPFTDTSSPTVRSIIVVRGQRQMSRLAIRGSVDVVVDAYDVSSLTVPPPWTDMPVSPGLVRWRLLRETTVVQGWRIPIDLRIALVPRSQFGKVFAPGTRQNRSYRAGRYRYFLARGWNTRLFPNGSYHLQVEAADVRGNTARASISIRIANATETL